ncbi:MAG: metallophosphoesterase family protein, partial [Planctomycetota bacterium]
MRLIVAVLSLMVSTCLLPDPVEGHEPNQKSLPASPAAVYRPSAMPDRICLSWTGDPATSISVTWRTSDDVLQSVAEWGLATDGPSFRNSVGRVLGTSQPLKTDLGLAKYHEATISGLEPKTKYLYRVGDGVNWSEWSEFQTASSTSDPFSFVYFGDAQNDIKSHWSRVMRNAFRDAPRAAFFLHAGDLVNRAESDAEWGEWFYAGGFIHRSIPAIAIPGNHEMAKRPGLSGVFSARRLSHHWRPTFAFPLNGPQLPDGPGGAARSLDESCYYIDHQGVRFVCLNSNHYQSEQVEWLDQVLAG